MIISRRIPCLCKRMKSCTRDNLRKISSEATLDVPSLSKSEKENSIIVDVDDEIMTIGINRSKQKNSLDVSTAQQLSEALDTFEKNNQISVGILYGMGGNFCAGYDLHEIAKHDVKSKTDLPQFTSLNSRDSLPTKPLLAAVEGYAVGVGLELALMCDLRVVDETSAFGFLNRRFGIPIMCGGTVRLPKLIGYSRAMDMILTGRLVSGKQALEYGLANVLVNCGTALGQALLLARQIASYPQNTLLSDRLSAHYATFSPIQVDEALQFEKDNALHNLFGDGVSVAKKFTKGLGRHGKSVNIQEREKPMDITDDLL